MRNLEEISAWLEQEIVPRYDNFDTGHRRDHAHDVMSRALKLLQQFDDVDATIALTAAAYHDTGLINGRERHHLDSGTIVRADERLLQWFTSAEIEIIAQAAEDHRASADHAPRSIYGRIVAEADRLIDAQHVFTRTVQYGLDHYPEMTRQQQYQRFIDHIHEKYAEGGYLKLWIEPSDNAIRLAELRKTINNPEALKAQFDTIWAQLHPGEK